MPPEGIDEPTEADGEQLDEKVDAMASVDGNESNVKESNDQENEKANHNVSEIYYDMKIICRKEKREKKCFPGESRRCVLLSFWITRN